MREENLRPAGAADPDGERREGIVQDPGITPALLDWYDSHKRVLPWREDPTAYHVWVSEVMLQQTRVEAVIGYYRRFLERLPDVRALAQAPEDVCLKLWEGLGYYSRVRNLHRAAVVIMEEYGGEMPRTAGELRRLPGIGAYTSAAIASIAFGERIPAVDGNLLRVFARLSLYREDIKRPAAAAAAREYFLGVMPEDRPGDFNQALMDLGAMVCAPGPGPACERGQSCPLQPFCGAFHTGSTSALPVMPARKARRIERRTVLVIRAGDGILIRRRPSRGLLAGLYELPNEKGWLTEEEAVRFARSCGCEPVRIRALPDARHVFTHIEWHMHGYEILAGSFPERNPDEAEKGLSRGEVLSEEALTTAGPDADGGDERGAHGPASGGAGQEPDPGTCFAVSTRSLKNQYAVPGAFAAYRPL